MNEIVGYLGQIIKKWILDRGDSLNIVDRVNRKDARDMFIFYAIRNELGHHFLDIPNHICPKCQLFFEHRWQGVNIEIFIAYQADDADVDVRTSLLAITHDRFEIGKIRIFQVKSDDREPASFQKMTPIEDKVLAIV